MVVESGGDNFIVLRKPWFATGIKEEYMLVDPVTRDLISDPDPEMFDRCKEIRGTIERVEDTIGSLKTCQRKKSGWVWPAGAPTKPNQLVVS